MSKMPIMLEHLLHSRSPRWFLFWKHLPAVNNNNNNNNCTTPLHTETRYLAFPSKCTYKFCDAYWYVISVSWWCHHVISTAWAIFLRVILTGFPCPQYSSVIMGHSHRNWRMLWHGRGNSLNGNFLLWKVTLLHKASRSTLYRNCRKLMTK